MKKLVALLGIVGAVAIVAPAGLAVGRRPRRPSA